MFTVDVKQQYNNNKILQELPGHVHFCMGAYGEYSSLLRNFGGFKLVTNLKETIEARILLTTTTPTTRRKASPSIAKVPSTYSYTRKNKYEKCNIRSEANIKDEP